MGKLAANRPDFANACIDHLADMFNDEIADVRIDAIRALTPLVTFGVLQSEQLRTLLTGLDVSLLQYTFQHIVIRFLRMLIKIVVLRFLNY